jgi:hypothetical protein
MTQFLYNGYTYDESTDWDRMVDEGSSGGWGRGLRDDAGSAAAAMGEFEIALGDSPLFALYADAVLRLIEKGTPEQVRAVEGLSYDRAPNAVARVVRLLETERARLDAIDPSYAVGLLWRMLNRHPHEPALLNVLVEEARRPGAPQMVLEQAAWTMPDWFAANLPALGVQPAPRDVLRWVMAVPEDKLDIVLDGIARAGLAPQLRDALMKTINVEVRDRVTLHARRHPLLAAQLPTV